MTAAAWAITVTDAPDKEARAVIEKGLAGYNKEQAGYSDSRPLAVLVSDPDTRAVVGGLTGRTSLGLAFIDLVFLPTTVRGQDVGRRMMRAAEEEARRRRCRAVVLYTISFQAPGFYEHLGYRRFGTIDCEPTGTSRIFFVKELGTESTA
jgi:GNAT superfamily N-acetyltransferase